MIKHIVLWKLHDRSDIELIKKTLEALPDQIPEIQYLEVGTGMPQGEFSADISLYTEFKSFDDLKTYVAHPVHRQAVDVIVPRTCERRVADYEVSDA